MRTLDLLLYLWRHRHLVYRWEAALRIIAEQGPHKWLSPAETQRIAFGVLPPTYPPHA